MQHQSTITRREAPWLGGLILVAVGAFLLLSYVAPGLGLYIVLGLGLVLMVAFVVTRVYAFLVPAGILTGLGIGIALLPFVSDGLTTGALITASLAAGFAAVGVIAYLFRLDEAHWWPFVPAAILGTVSIFLALGNPQALEWLGVAFAAAMIVVGSWLIFRRRGEV